jgi:diguanylate cyclase (GGDEF)-like protein
MFHVPNRFQNSPHAKRILTLVPGLVVVIAVLWALRIPSFAPLGILPHSGEMFLWSAVGALAALHRPWGGATLGLGTLVLAPVASRLGTLPTALVAGSIFLLSRLALATARRLLGRLKEVWGFGRTLTQTVSVVGATLAAATVAEAIEGRLGMMETLVPPLAYVAAFTLFAPRTSGAAGEHRTPLLLDATGWGVGVLFTEAARIAAGWESVAPLIVVVALLSAEAARNGMLRGVSDHRADDLERVQEAHARILGETSGMGEIAQQILVECSNVMPVSWYQFELLPAVLGERQSWTSGPDGILHEAEPSPPRFPHMLPGVHRRARWQVIENTLIAEGEPLAVVRLWCDPRRATPGAEALLASLVPQMASSVHRARLDREAKLDPLTGVPVRRLLESRMQKAFRRSLEENVPMAVIMCDIDFFKKVNDTHGHDAGDQALILVAHTLEAHRRESDLCCRYGGEEFTILLEDTRGDAALRLAERLRAAIEALAMEYDGQAIPLTLTLGVAAYPELHIKTASELLLLADEALYQGKERGRNRALLNLGWGRYKEVSGTTFIDEKAAAKAGPPRIFN